MAWAAQKLIPPSCMHLDRRAIEAELIANDGNITATAKTLDVPSADLRRLVWSTDLAETVYEAIEAALDEAQGVAAGGARRRR